MNLPWLKNHVSMTLSDAEMEDIPNATVEMNTHVFIKFLQAGSLLGAGIIGPVVSVMKPSGRNMAALVQRSRRYGRNGILFGLVAAPAMTYMKIKDATPESITDRCYRLRHNRAQVRVDRAAAVGALVGAGLLASGAGPFLGAMWGCSAGVMGMAVYNNAGGASK